MRNQPTRFSPVRLNYNALDTALHDKKRRGRGFVDKLLLSYNVSAYRVYGESIAVKLHNTEILTFYPGGDCVLRGEHWQTQLTKHWIGQAWPYKIANFKANEWSCGAWYWAKLTLFYDGLRVNRYGEPQSEIKMGEKRIPSAEAYAIRKQWLAVAKEKYLPHLRMIEPHQVERIVDNRPYFRWWEVFNAGEFNYDLMVTALNTRGWSFTPKTHPYKVFKVELDKQWRQSVREHNLFDSIPWLPE